MPNKRSFSLFLIFLFTLNINLVHGIAQSAGAVEYTDCFSVEE